VKLELGLDVRLGSVVGEGLGRRVGVRAGVDVAAGVASGKVKVGLTRVAVRRLSACGLITGNNPAARQEIKPSTINIAKIIRIRRI
jgi:hypothetical protein